MNPPDHTPRPERKDDWERDLDASLKEVSDLVSSASLVPDVDGLLDAELRKLPELEAPADLLPNVMALVRAQEALRAKVWWRRPATMWPPALRMGFAVAAVAVLGALVIGGHLLWPEIQASPVANMFSALGAKFSALWSAGRTLVEAISLALHSVFTPLRLAILGAIILSQVALFGAGSAAMRALLQPRRTV